MTSLKELQVSPGEMEKTVCTTIVPQVLHQYKLNGRELKVQSRSLPVSFHHINKVIGCDITAQSYVGVVDLVL